MLYYLSLKLILSGKCVINILQNYSTLLWNINLGDYLCIFIKSLHLFHL